METPSRCSGWESSLPPANMRAHFLLLAHCTSGAMEPNYLRLSPEIVQQKRNPVASLWWVSLAVAAKQNCQSPVLLYTSSEHTWYGVSVTPLLCLSLSFWKATKSIKAQPEVCVVPWYPRPRNSCLIPLLALHSYCGGEKASKCLNCVFKIGHCFLLRTIVGEL